MMWALGIRSKPDVQIAIKLYHIQNWTGKKDARQKSFRKCQKITEDKLLYW